MFGSASGSSMSDPGPPGNRPASPRRKPEPATAGFTLVELLVVLVILGLLAGLAGPRVLGVLGQSRQQAARIQLEQLAAALDLYALDFGRFPPQVPGLEALVAPPGGKTAGRAGYLNRSTVPADPWGYPYHYRLAPDRQGGYELFSLGADGRDGGDGENRDVRLSR